jgi:hypothetical protein
MTETSTKVKILNISGEDREWYPTTDEILAKMNEDLHALFAEKELARGTRRFNGKELFDYHSAYNREIQKDQYVYFVRSILDVGAGDGRVFDALSGINNDIEIGRRYGIEIAQSQADDLIARNVFIIGRDFFKTSLIDKAYGVVFSNPPFSTFVPWVRKLLAEANFGVMYLVLPIRWKRSLGENSGLDLYDVKTIGGFDFHHADRAARARVSLVRLIHKKAKVEDRYGNGIYGTRLVYGKDDAPDSFSRWIEEHLGAFDADMPEAGEEHELKLKGEGTAELVENYEYEMKTLLDAFRAFGNMPSRVITALGMNRASVQEIIRENIRTLKHRYWQYAFDKLAPIRSRLTRKKRHSLLSEMAEFDTLDFNGENIRSIVVWVISNVNKYSGEQLLEVFDELTNQDCLKAYKSNVHWTQDDWRYAKGKGKPDKHTLDYRLVTRCYKSYSCDDCVVDDFIVICRTLGYCIPDYRHFDYSLKGVEQVFYTTDGETAFMVRYYKNGNAHLKIHEKLMMKFNIEVARLRHWINSHTDIEDEFEVSPIEAYKLWHNPALQGIGQRDVKLLGFGGIEDGECA